MKTIRIANTQGFWGDRQQATAELLKKETDIDYITMDFLAEVSMSIMASEKEKGRSGYASDFPKIIASIVPFWNEGRLFKVIANAGGLDPKGCAESVLKELEGINCPLKIAYVTGDDVLSLLQNATQDDYPNLETAKNIGSIQDRLVTANAYLGADVIKQALSLGADIVITGRVADPSLTVGPCLYEFNWGPVDFDQMAGATVAGHLIECGTQVTGGISSRWLEIEDASSMGFPIAEIREDGTFTITKPEGTGGLVNIDTVKEQLLYEIGDPDQYISPDVIVSFTRLELEQSGTNRVDVRNAKGRQTTSTYKVAATYRSDFRAEGMLVIFGDQAVRKARRLGQIILDRVNAQGYDFNDSVIECLGCGDASAGPKDYSVPEVVLRIAVEGSWEALSCFSKEIAPCVTAGPQGVSGYLGGRPKIRQVFKYYPTLIEKEKVQTNVVIIAREPL